jgi:hypothetical protein
MDLANRRWSLLAPAMGDAALEPIYGETDIGGPSGT